MRDLYSHAMRFALAFVALMLPACAPEPAHSEPPIVTPAPAVSNPAEPVAEANDERWHATLRAIAGGYKTWGKVDDQMRWAPTSCAMPQPPRARISASGDESTHGRKLYTLYAKDPEAYGAHRSFTPAPAIAGLEQVAQVVVKEAFRPVESDQPDNRFALGGEMRPAHHQGKTYVAGEPQGIYVVFQPGKDIVGATDAGWVYGTVAADLTTVTSSGKVASCMGCHQKVASGRLFGLNDKESKQLLPPGPVPDGRHH